MLSTVVPTYLTRCKLLAVPGESFKFSADRSKKAALEKMKGLIPESSYHQLRGFYDSLTRAQRNNFTPALYHQILQDLEQVLTAGADIQRIFPASYSLAAKIEVLTKNYATALDSSASLKDRSGYFVDWIRNDDQAFYAYGLLMNTAFGREKALITRVLDESPFFSGVYRQRDEPALVITTSFEKETHSRAITAYYKDVKYSDEEWMRFSESERYRILLERKQIVKTKNCPSDLGNLSWEILPDGNYMPEMKSKSYNLNHNKTLSQIEDYKKLTGEAHSFHLHTAFHAPRYDKSYYSAFIGWYERLNTYLYFKGLEERLFPGRNIKFLNWETIDVAREQVVTDFSALFSQRSTKPFSAGLRSGLYGDSFLKEYMKIGVELRDVTRDISILKEIEHRLIEAISTQVWFKNNYSAKGLFRLSDEVERVFTTAHIQKFTQQFGIDQARVVRLMRLEPQVLVPLIDYKNRVYLAVKEGGSEFSQKQVQRIESAEQKYIANIKNLNQSIDAEIAKGTFSDQDWENVIAVIRWEVADWAKEAKVSEFLNPFN